MELQQKTEYKLLKINSPHILILPQKGIRGMGLNYEFHQSNEGGYQSHCK